MSWGGEILPNTTHDDGPAIIATVDNVESIGRGSRNEAMMRMINIDN